MSLEVVIDTEMLVVGLQSAELSQKWQIFTRILRLQYIRKHEFKISRGTYFLGVLGDHQNQRKVVHPKGDVEECIRVNEEDDVLDCIFDEIRVVL